MIKIGLLVGVSTDEQAKAERGSIDDQIKTCRHAVRQLGGVEVNCYIMDGFSRTGYDSLAEAMADIPPLGEAVRDAEADKYDVLMLDNFDRLGDLGILLSNRFKKIRKQLYSARQSGRLQDPATYDPYADDATDIGIGVGFLLQKYRLAKLQRGHKLGIEKRVKDGKYSVRFPIGYKKINKDLPLELDPVNAPILVMLKDEFLNGKSLDELQEIAAAVGFTTANGKGRNVYRLLLNPFYAGKVFHGYHRGKNPEVLQDGSHPALWSYDEHLKILDEMRIRYNRSPRHHVKVWSGLLFCSVCDKKLWHMAGVWRCPGRDHVTFYDSDSIDLIAPQITEKLKNYTEDEQTDTTYDTSKARAELQKKIERIQHGYENGLYNITQATEKMNAVKSQIAALENEDARREEAERRKREFMSSREALGKILDDFADTLKVAPAKESNLLLRSILDRIKITPIERGEKWEFTFVWRS